MRQSGDAVSSFSGAQFEAEDATGKAFYGLTGFGVLGGPDTPRLAQTYSEQLSSTSIGGFIQDSWNIPTQDHAEHRRSLRPQSIYGNDRMLGMALPNQSVPRIGVIWDPDVRGAPRSTQLSAPTTRMSTTDRRAVLP